MTIKHTLPDNTEAIRRHTRNTKDYILHLYIYLYDLNTLCRGREWKMPNDMRVRLNIPKISDFLRSVPENPLDLTPIIRKMSNYIYVFKGANFHLPKLGTLRLEDNIICYETEVIAIELMSMILQQTSSHESGGLYAISTSTLSLEERRQYILDCLKSYLDAVNQHVLMT